jgi:phosphatidylserine decarboxylase
VKALRAAARCADPLMTPDRLAVLPQYLLPKQALTRAGRRVAGAGGGALTTALIRWFVGATASTWPRRPSPTSPLRQLQRLLHAGAEARRAAAGRADWLCPVDGAISQFGRIERRPDLPGQGPHYSATALVGGDAALAAQFDDGHFATLYLSPRDYHRIHMPCAGRLRA